MITIDKGVAIPLRTTKSDRYAFRELEIGDSYLIPQGDERETRNKASRHKRMTPGFNFTTRKEGDRVRLWRTA